MSDKFEEIRVIYRELKHGENPPKPKPPMPCSSWCAREKIKENGSIEVTIMPWLDEAHDKKVIAGTDSSGNVIYVDHLKFQDPDYMVFEESHAKLDEKGNVVFKNDDDGNQVLGRNGVPIPECDFDYVVGVPGIAFISQHMFRLSAATKAVNTNMLGGFEAVLKLLYHRSENMDAPTSGSALPNGDTGIEVD